MIGASLSKGYYVGGIMTPHPQASGMIQERICVAGVVEKLWMIHGSIILRADFVDNGQIGGKCQNFVHLPPICLGTDG